MDWTLLMSAWQGCCARVGENFVHLSKDPDLFTLILPVAFFGVAALFMKRSPFYAPEIAAKVDARLGAMAYESFLVRLKPILLFAVGGTITGLGLLARGHLEGHPAAVSVAGFFLSGSVGFGLAHLILRMKEAKGV